MQQLHAFIKGKIHNVINFSKDSLVNSQELLW